MKTVLARSVFFLLLIAAGLTTYMYASIYANKKPTPAAPYTFTQVPISSLAPVQAPTLPDLSAYTKETVLKKWPKVQAGQVTLDYVWDSQDFKFLQTKEDINFIADRQENDDPVIIVIDKGVYTLASLTKAVNNPKYLRKTDKGYLLRAPIIIHHGAGLVLKGQGDTLLMSIEGGGLIISYGQFFAVDTLITSWQESTQSPAQFDDVKIFRPYLTFLSGSETYIASSTLQYLGYESSKGYGLVFSSNSNLKDKKSLAFPAQIGWVLDSEIINLYYGYYTYEASDMVLLRSRFTDNIIYGVDPHDRSERLIIGYNEISGTHKKHGLIISREVNHSWIFYNESYNNAGSGIMLDRNCRNNVIAFNKLHNNKGDGLFFSESHDNLSWQNRLYRNEKSGLRVRNSTGIISSNDEIVGNHQTGIMSYTADLANTERDIALDPYEQKSSLRIEHLGISHNATAQYLFTDTSPITIYDNKILLAPDGKLLDGDIPTTDNDFYDRVARPESALVIEKSN